MVLSSEKEVGSENNSKNINQKRALLFVTVGYRLSLPDGKDKCFL
nr:MAG TPA: hypothetical protein [Caudoviricetes sp.]